jgi:hypothetical protein
MTLECLNRWYDKQEWEICDIVGKEDVDGVPHYWVQWSATLVSKYDR